MEPTDLKAPFINRELSWLEFNHRVLEEAKDNKNPLFERLKFLSIVSSNLDEFFMVRVATLRDQVFAGFEEPDPSGLTPKEQLVRISERTHRMAAEQYQCYRRSVLPALRRQGVRFERVADLPPVQQEAISAYYWKEVYPVLTPMAVDHSRPFPLVLNRSLNIGLLIRSADVGDEPILALVQVPSVLDRLMEVPGSGGVRSFVFLEDIIKHHVETLFRGHKILTMACFRITRNADLGFDEEGAEDLLAAIEQSVKKRRWGAVIRLETEAAMDPALLGILSEEIDVPEGGTYLIQGPLDLTHLMRFSRAEGYDALRDAPLETGASPAFAESGDVFEAIAENDILLHHPYESFDPVIELVRQAAADPKVLAIKQTLYRVSGQSPIVEALVEAAENGKQVTVLVELKARFDEENNIHWAKRLERAGCHVIYGLVGLKTHCKILLVVRRETDGIKRYVHLSTGNYNDVTARLYTDIGLFTKNPYMGADVSAIFNMLSGYSQPTRLYKLVIAPISLRQRFLAMIAREAAHARAGKRACISAKMNSLVDEEVIEALYEASRAGVSIDLLVRGICCLNPGIKGMSENIRVVSIVGRFLEHSRIFCFHNDGAEEVYLSSADWMPRNLDRRVELLFPIENQELASRTRKMLETSFQDTAKARVMESGGTYIRVMRHGVKAFSSQEAFLAEAAIQGIRKTVPSEEIFHPISST